MYGLSPLDIVLLAAIGLGAWRGMATGAMRQIVGVVGVIAAFWFAAVLMDSAGHAVVTSLDLSERVAPAVGFLVVFMGVLAALAAVSHLARAVLDSLRMGFVDRGLGALFGGLRTAFVLSVLLLVSGGAAIPGTGGLLVQTETRQQSVLYEPVLALAPALWDGFRVVAPGWQYQLLDKLQSLEGSSRLAN